MAKKTVVFGSSYAVRKFIAGKENRENFINVRNIDSIRGIEIEAIIKLEGWKNCYDKPDELMDEAEYLLKLDEEAKYIFRINKMVNNK